MDLKGLNSFNRIDTASGKARQLSTPPETDQTPSDSVIISSSPQNNCSENEALKNEVLQKQAAKVKDAETVELPYNNGSIIKKDSESEFDAKKITPIPKDLYKVSPDGKVKKVTFIYDSDKRENIDNLTLVGSWDNNTGRYSNEWKNSSVAMQKDEQGRWTAQVDLLNDSEHNWQWGVVADAPTGKSQWAIFEEKPLSVDISKDKPLASYSPTTYTQMGSVRDGNDVKFKMWAPHAQDAKVKIWDNDPDSAEYVKLQKDPETGMWTGGAENGWDKFNGKCYAYELINSEGQKVLRADPYARRLQGQQRGVSKFYLHPVTGKEVNKYYKDPGLESQGKDSRAPFARFEVQDHENAESVSLSLFDREGKKLSKEDLIKRLGNNNSELVDKYHEGKNNDFYLKNISDDGSIKMAKHGSAWAATVNNPDMLAGLEYRFEIREKDKDGNIKLVGDINKDGMLSSKEARKTAFNDPYSGVIDSNFGWERFGIITDPADFSWQNDKNPRLAATKDKAIIYQLHVGSIFGDAKNTDRSTFKDVIKKLDYFKELGVNTLEFLPVNTLDDSRDWGYTGTSSFAVTDQYGFEDENGKWLSGDVALKKLIDTAHGMGLSVINDVVYNHWGGIYNNLWEFDGKKNSYMDWENNPNITSDGISRGRKETPWGAMPAYNKDSVKQFIVDNAMSQLDELHFDSLRFDVTHLIHDPQGGGQDGWNMLRKLNREVHFFHPSAVTSAEEFPNAEYVTNPAFSDGGGGIGFDSMWNTEFQHRLVHDQWNPSILQQAVRGQQTNMDYFMYHMLKHPGFSNYLNSTTIITNHDEVGNADRTINIATNNHEGLPNQWERGAVRMTFGVGMLSPGMPIFFQGEESLATNKFTWGIPSTWDNGWKWLDAAKDTDWSKAELDGKKMQSFDKLLDISEQERINNPEYFNLSDTDRKIFDYLASALPENREEAKMDIYRKVHHDFCKDVIGLRNSTPAFDGDAQAERVYTHNDNSVMAYSRKKNGEEYIVVASLNKNDFSDYNIPIPEGKWELVLDSDSKKYGGNGVGEDKKIINGGSKAKFDIPKGGLLVFKQKN